MKVLSGSCWTGPDAASGRWSALRAVPRSAEDRRGPGGRSRAERDRPADIANIHPQFEAERLELGRHALQRRPVQT